MCGWVAGRGVYVTPERKTTAKTPGEECNARLGRASRPHTVLACGLDEQRDYLALAVTDGVLARLRRAALTEGSGVPVAARRARTSLAS